MYVKLLYCELFLLLITHLDAGNPMSNQGLSQVSNVIERHFEKQTYEYSSLQRHNLGITFLTGKYPYHFVFMPPLTLWTLSLTAKHHNIR